VDLWAHGYGRAALDRMMRMHRMIEDREYPNCTKMSAEFAMSVRTLKRDIEFMKDRLNMPIEFDVRRNGYYFARPQPHFPRVPLTEKEIVDHCRAYLAHFKAPRHVIFSVLPKTSTGKIQKFVLRQQARSASAIE